MYEQNFGLKKTLFRAVAVGPNVFVGPQTATAMASLKKALKSDAAVVTVSGPAGAGKTTLVGKALMAIGDVKTTILIGRIRLDIDDVLGLLLKELNVKPVPSGTLQKFAAFRQTLCELESRNSRLIIVVEDAARMGAETLAELEALTATDAGPSAGANIVLMADEQLDELLQAPKLARLTQRIRQRLTIAPLCASELRGYLRHCFRLAGGDFEQIFSDNAVALLHHLSDGNPRTANNIVESALKAATEENQQRVASNLLSKVAADEYGLSSAGFTPVKAPAGELTEVADNNANAELDSASEANPEPLAEPSAEVSDEPVIVFSDARDDATEDDEIPEFINDTLPNLETLSPELTNAARQALDDESELPVADAVADDVPKLIVTDAAVEDVPELVVADATADAHVVGVDVPELVTADPVAGDDVPELSVAENVAEQTPEPLAPSETGFKLELESTRVDMPAATVPDSDRDPTLAELKPDLAALEEAMAYTRTGMLASDSEQAPARPAETLEAPQTAEVSDLIPEITLDNAINERIESELAADSDDDSIDDSAVNSIVEGFAKAKSIEDIDDRMAETLFGEEFSLIASQVVAKASEFESANDEPACAAPLDQELASADLKSDAEAPRMSATSNAAAVELTLDAPAAAPSTAVDLGATQQRLNMVRELNSAPKPAQPLPNLTAANESAPQPPAGQAPVDPPEPIENQINTSITQTLKALSLKDLPDDDDTDEEEERKSGFFSRFKRS